MTHLSTKLWSHQQRAFEFAKDKQGVLLGMEMGTGKSLVAIALANHWEANLILILGPLSILNVWKREFEKHLPGIYRLLILNKGSGRQKAYKISDALKLNSPLAVVLNYESAWRPILRELIFLQNFDLVIFDESHRIKSPGGKHSWFCKELSKRVPRRVALTGTPMPHSPLDIYAQFRALDTSVFGTSFSRFKLKYATMGGFEGRQVVGFKNQDDMRGKFNSISFQVSKKEALDLPEEIHNDITLTLAPAAMKKYKEMERDFYTQVEEGEVTASNALVKLLRLAQMTSGFIKDDAGKEIQFDKCKKTLLLEILLDIPKETPVVVFARFKHDLQTIESIADETNRRYGEVSGRRKDLTSHAMYPDEVDLMGVQIQSGGVGIDLTRASIGIYYSMGFSLGDYVQSLSRLHRPGQINKVSFYHLIAKGTVDEKVYRALQQRQDVVNEILGVSHGIYEKNGRTCEAQATA